MVCSCRRVVFFRAVLESKKLKICVYFCDGYREFFTLCLIRERERVRREDGGKKLRDVVSMKRCVFVDVCVQHQIAGLLS